MNIQDYQEHYVDQKEKVSPVYSSVPVLSQLFKLLTERSLRVLDTKYLSAYGIRGSEAYKAVASLKFLGLLNQDGDVTDRAKFFRLQGDVRRKELQDIIRVAYSALFERAEDAPRLPEEELNNEFVGIYDLSPRIAKPAVRAFLWLCEEAGLRDRVAEERGEIGAKPMRQKYGGEKLPSAPVQQWSNLIHLRNFGAPQKQVFNFDGGIELHVPITDRVSEAIVDGKLRGIGEEIRKFSNDFIKDLDASGE